MSLLVWLRGGSKGVNAFEAAILAQVETLLDPAMAERWRRRIAAIDLVQRHGGGQEIYLYQRQRGKVIFPPETAIVDDLRCIDFALVETRSGQAMSRLRATIGLMNGNLASIIFDRPSEHADIADVADLRAEILGPPFRDEDAGDASVDGWPAN